MAPATRPLACDRSTSRRSPRSRVSPGRRSRTAALPTTQAPTSSTTQTSRRRRTRRSPLRTTSTMRPARRSLLYDDVDRSGGWRADGERHRREWWRQLQLRHRRQLHDRHPHRLRRDAERNRVRARVLHPRRTSASYSSPDTCGSFGAPTTITGTTSQTGAHDRLLPVHAHRHRQRRQRRLDLDDRQGRHHRPGRPDAHRVGRDRHAYYPRLRHHASTSSAARPAASRHRQRRRRRHRHRLLRLPRRSPAPAGSGQPAAPTRYTAAATDTGAGTSPPPTTPAARRQHELHRQADSTAPTGGALTVNGTAASGGGSSSYDTARRFTIGTRTDYTETQSATESGLASSTLTIADRHAHQQHLRQLRRADARSPAPPAQSVAQRPLLPVHAHRHRQRRQHHVDHRRTVKVDTTAPAAPSVSRSGVATGSAYYPGSGTTSTSSRRRHGGFTSPPTLDRRRHRHRLLHLPGARRHRLVELGRRTYSYTRHAPPRRPARSHGATNNAGRTGPAPPSPPAPTRPPRPAARSRSTAPPRVAAAARATTPTAHASRSAPAPTTPRRRARPQSGLASSTLTIESATLTARHLRQLRLAHHDHRHPQRDRRSAAGCYQYTLTGTDNVGNTDLDHDDRQGRHLRPGRPDARPRRTRPAAPTTPARAPASTSSPAPPAAASHHRQLERQRHRHRLLRLPRRLSTRHQLVRLRRGAPAPTATPPPPPATAPRTSPRPTTPAARPAPPSPSRSTRPLRRVVR